MEEFSLTGQLQRFSNGDRTFAEAVLSEVLPNLHRIAVRELRRERHAAPVSPTELINEVWLRHLHKGGWQIESRQHFYAVASRAMRQVLVDLARNRLAQKRGPALESIEETGADVQTASPEQIVEIGILMEKLDKADPEAALVVNMHYFAGFTLQEVTEIERLSLRQVRNRWERGRDWLKDRMAG
jgi:RNA polymerase sigma factor (TIGR02999 family)